MLPVRLPDNGLGGAVTLREKLVGFICNGDVAWEIPRGPISYAFVHEYYLAPDGWHVHGGPPPGQWRTGAVGELRIIEGEKSCQRMKETAISR